MRSTCYVLSFNFYPWCGFRDTEVQSFSVLPIWLPHDVTYDVIIIIKTFYMSSCSYRENCVIIRQAVAEENTKVLCGQTERQTDKQTDPNAIPSPSARAVKGDYLTRPDQTISQISPV